MQAHLKLTHSIAESRQFRSGAQIPFLKAGDQADGTRFEARDFRVTYRHQ